MKKIVIITPSLKPGGLERVVSLLANKGVNNFKITLLTLDNKHPFYKLNNSVELIQCPKRISNQKKVFRFFTNAIWLRRELKNLKPDVVCSFGEKYNSFVLLAALGLGFPVFVANRASPISSLKGFRGLVNPVFYRLAAGVLLQTQKSKELLTPNYKFRKTVVIGNPIDLNYPVLSKESTVLNVGSIGGKKNQDWLISYFSNCIDKIHEEWNLEFVGDGSRREYCEKLVQKNNLNHQHPIIFHGIQKNPKPFYARASIFAFTSTSEGFPNALGEAMAAGCACIAYDCIAGPSDIIDDGVNGFLIPVGDHELFQDKLKHLMQNQDLREKFGKNAREKMKLFRADKIAEKFYQYITEDL